MMGSFMSKDFIDLSEESVPNTPVSYKRPLGLAFDPRSPTVGISRTPIQVEKTPQRVDDPRSPTIGIFRTPIVGSDDEDENSCTSGISAISSVNLSSSLSNCSLLDIQPLTLQSALESLPALDLSDEDHIDDGEQPGDYLTHYTPSIGDRLVEMQQSHVDKQPQPIKIHSDVSENSSGQILINRKTKSASFQVHSDNTHSPKELQSSPKTYQSSPKTYQSSPKDFQPSPLRMMADSHQRSPLAKRNIDVSSPRHIVQRKQANKLGMLKAMSKTPVSKSTIGSPCRIEAISMEDKENITM